MPFFEKIRRFSIEGSAFFDGGSPTVNIHNYFSRSGFKQLREAALPQAMHDSSDRRPARCSPGTRDEHLHNMTAWGNGEWKSRRARVLLMQGPPGVGKSAVAQTWAESLKDKLAASFFFSRANHWNHPEALLPTIAYQLAIKSPSFKKVIDAAILHDPFILEHTILAQFEELLVKPLRELSSEDCGALNDTIIIVDGLDECNGPGAQRDIINVITASAAEGTTPFLWAFFSRPEPHIMATLSSDRALDVCWRLTLPASSFANEDIRAILCGGLERIRAKHDLPTDWVSDQDIDQLVRQADGIFVYGTVAIHFIDGNQQSSESVQPGPRERLRSLLETPEGPRNELPRLDQLYLLIMDQIPKATVPTTLLLLCANHYTPSYNIPVLSSLLGLSEPAIESAIHPLSSVVEVASSRVRGKWQPCLRFSHTDFIDFLVATERSTTQYSINTPTICNRLYSTCVDVVLRGLVPPPALSLVFLKIFRYKQENEVLAYQVAVNALVRLPERISSSLRFHELEILERLSSIDWKPASIYCLKRMFFSQETVEAFIQQIPDDWRWRIINPRVDTTRNKYVLGNGNNRVVLQDSLTGAGYFLAHFFEYKSLRDHLFWYYYVFHHN